MPYDILSNDHLQEYNDILSKSSMSTCMYEHQVEHSLIAGDLNTDLSRIQSGNTISLSSFVDNENLAFALKTIPTKVSHTYTGIRQSKSLIDHFIVSQNVAKYIINYYVQDSVDNLSDHIPLYCSISCSMECTIYVQRRCTKNSKPQ